MQQWLDDKPEPMPAGFCDGCGAPVTDIDRFCTACGRPQRDLCSWCGAELAADARFCASCGRPAVHDRARIYQRKAIAGKPIAGFGLRAGVYVADGLILSTIVGIAGQVLPGSLFSDPTEELEALNDRQQGGEVVALGEFVDVLAPLLLFYAIYFVVTGLILPWIWNSIGWSPAKRIIGLRIVDADGNAPGWRRGLGRTAATWLSGLALGLGYLTAVWHLEKRTWHDRMAGTWVVDVRERR